jgi:hypothetical protein
LAKIGDIAFVAIVRTVERERSSVEAHDPKSEAQQRRTEPFAALCSVKTYREQVTHQRVSGHDRPLHRAGM